MRLFTNHEKNNMKISLIIFSHLVLHTTKASHMTCCNGLLKIHPIHPGINNAINFSPTCSGKYRLSHERQGISVLSLERQYHILSRVSAVNEGRNMIS